MISYILISAWTSLSIFFVFFHSQNFSTTSNYTIVEGDYMSLAGPYSIGMAHEVLLVLSIRYVILHDPKLFLGFLNIALFDDTLF